MLNLTLSDIIILHQRCEIWNSIPENNGALKHCLCIIQVHQNSFLQHAATHLMNNSYYQVRACFYVDSLTLILFTWNESFRKIVKPQTNRNCFQIYRDVLSCQLCSEYFILGQRHGVKYDSFQWYMYRYILRTSAFV